MREIKFRAWDRKVMHTDNVCIIGGDVALDTGELDWDFDFKFGLIGMQFTGRKDLEGTDIFQGDILIDASQGSIWVVGFSYRGFLVAHDPEDPEDFVFLDDLDFIVHGNIYENPELLEKSE